MKAIKFLAATTPFPAYDGFLVRFSYIEKGVDLPNWYDVAVGHQVFFGWESHSTEEQRNNYALVMFNELIKAIKQHWQENKMLPSNDFPYIPSSRLKVDSENQLDWKNYELILE